jgi:KRAB domain-containing zinc finger protein
MIRHINLRKNKCHLCDKSFFRKYSLKIHLLRHEEEKPFPCPVKNCHSKFTKKFNLNSHIKKMVNIFYKNSLIKL